MASFDPRRWTNGQPEFAVAALILWIEPSELDFVEVGHRVAVAHANGIADEWEKTTCQTYRVLHPADIRPELIDGSGGAS